MDHRGCDDNSALLASVVTLCPVTLCHGEGIDPFRSEVPQLVAPNLRVCRAVPLQSLPGESCRDLTRRPQTPQLMAWSFPQASSWLVTAIVVLRHWGQAAARWTCMAFFSAQQTAVFERAGADPGCQLCRASQ